MMCNVKVNRFLCILLTIIMAFNFFTFPARAELLTAAAASVILGLALGAIAELSAGLITEAIEAGNEAYESAVVTLRSAFHNLDQQHNSILVEYTHIDSDIRYDKINRVYPNPSLTGVELELATRLCNTINNAGNIESYLSYDPLSQSLVVTFEGYQKLKNLVVNAWLFEVNEAGGAALDEAVGGLPTYDFDFVGPVQGMTLPSGTKRIGLTKDGFTFSAPMSYAPNGYFRIKIVEAAGLTPSFFTAEMKEQGYCVGAYSSNISCYGGASYVIFNNKIYYFKSFNATETSYSRNFSLPSFINLQGEYSGNFGVFVSSDGESLDQVATVSDIPFFYVGYVYSSNYTGYAYPGEDVKIDPAEMVVETEGGSLDIPLTEAEAALVGGLGFGLLNNNSLLALNADGSIASADGITIDKLQQILEALQSGTLEFDDIQSYLQTMSTLIANSNLTENQQLTVLKSLKDFAEEQNNDIAAINANIAAIAKALEMEAELDIELEIDKPELEASLITVEHTGLAESKTIVDTALPIVGQSQTLISNLFNRVSSASSSVFSAPNFSFYWDSNGDGVTEKYTILDLSFMEQTLTNDNLEDKDRFKKPMTVREFIQLFIILISYVLFALKVLKKLPGLFGGAESTSESIFSSIVSSKSK